MAYVIENTDVRVLQVGDGFGFALEPLPHVRPVRQMRQQNLEGHDAVQARVPGLIDFPPIPPAPISKRISCGPRCVPGFSAICFPNTVVPCRARKQAVKAGVRCQVPDPSTWNLTFNTFRDRSLTVAARILTSDSCLVVKFASEG